MLADLGVANQDIACIEENYESVLVAWYLPFVIPAPLHDISTNNHRKKGGQVGGKLFDVSKISGSNTRFNRMTKSMDTAYPDNLI